MSRIARSGIGSLMLVSAVACKATTPPFARLESAVTNDRYAGSPARADVRIVRGDSVVSPNVSMRLLKGDSIITSRTTRVVVNFRAGYEVTLDTNTAIYIENPSIFLRIGQAFIRKLLGTGNAPDTATLDTHTPQATLHDAGTEYLVRVNGGATDVRVVSGAVEVASRDGRWSRVRYSAGEQGRIDGQRGPVSMGRFTERQIEQELAWVRRVERITKVPVPQLDSLTEDAARATLARAGFRVLFVMHRETDQAAPGRVVDQSPGAGQLEAPGTYVTLTLAKAPSNAMCTVPGITGKTVNEASRLLENARLKGEPTVLDRRSPTVTSQEPKEKTKVACGSTVKYTIGTTIR